MHLRTLLNKALQANYQITVTTPEGETPVVKGDRIYHIIRTIMPLREYRLTFHHQDGSHGGYADVLDHDVTEFSLSCAIAPPTTGPNGLLVAPF